MDTDKRKQRRNLIAVAVGLAVFELAGGSVDKLSLMGGGIKLHDAGRMIVLGYLALGYFSWRYWLYTRPDHAEFKELLRKTIEKSGGYRKLVEPLVTAFREKSGVAAEEGFQDGFNDVAPDDKKIEHLEIPVESIIEFGKFSRKLVIRVDNPRGNFNPDREEHKLPFMRFELLWLRAVGLLAASDKIFSDLYVPHLLALMAFGAMLVRWWAA